MPKFIYVPIFYVQYIFYVIFSALRRDEIRDKSIRKNVARIKKSRHTGEEFDCDGYIVRIYKPGTNMDGPWEA